MGYNLLYRPRIVAPDDDFAITLRELGGRQYVKRVLSIIEDAEGRRIGEITGYRLFTNGILKNKKTAFLVMDALSELLVNSFFLIVDNEESFRERKEILYINRLTLYEKYHEINTERDILRFLETEYDAVFYSLGHTELCDEDFSSYQDEEWFNFWKAQLERNWGDCSEYGIYSSVRL